MLASSRSLVAQTTTVADTIAEARRLRDAKEFAAAAALLAPYSESHPGDVGTARFAALMAYWAKDVASARAIYERALERHANDADLRIDAAQFLAENGQVSRARELVTPLADSGARDLATTKRALTLLGTVKYWVGDFGGARALFIEALRLDSTDATSRRQLREIELASAAWIRVGAHGWHDDQPLNRAAFDVDAGWFATPVTPFSVRVESTQLSHDDVSETVSHAEATLKTFWPAARMDLGLTGGLLNRTFGDASDWTARAALGFRMPRDVALEGSYERAPYVSTAASIATTVMTQSVGGALRLRSPSGWWGDVVAKREAFQDDNAITTGYAWLLAPIVRRRGGQLQVGYSFAAQAATSSRFVPDDPNAAPGPPSTTLRGVYDPYYTPRNLRVHSGLAGVTLRPTDRWTLSANGGWGFNASDDAPTLETGVGRPPNAPPLVRTYYRRSFTPRSIRAALDGAATESLRVSLTAEHGKEAFYGYTNAGVRVTYLFMGAARRRADRF